MQVHIEAYKWEDHGPIDSSHTTYALDIMSMEVYNTTWSLLSGYLQVYGTMAVSPIGFYFPYIVDNLA
jgi:hypothetical protein